LKFAPAGVPARVVEAPGSCHCMMRDSEGSNGQRDVFNCDTVNVMCRKWGSWKESRVGLERFRRLDWHSGAQAAAADYPWLDIFRVTQDGDTCPCWRTQGRASVAMGRRSLVVVVTPGADVRRSAYAD
jgi:hypothetical protein